MQDRELNEHTNQQDNKQLSNEEAMMLLILALMEEVDSLKTKVYILYGLLVIGGILWIW